VTGVERSRSLAAPPAAVWAVISEPQRLAGWWPRTERVEGVTAEAWTLVLRSPKGKLVRADHRLTASELERRRAWELVVAGTPFERLVRDSQTELRLVPDADGTAVTLSGRRRLRGLNRLGAPAVRRRCSGAGGSRAPGRSCRTAPPLCCATSSA
jgi:uncharacterized protein YndB with AHSA1/START domain